MLIFHVVELPLFTEELAGGRSIFHFFIWILPADRSAKYFHGANVIAERRALLKS